MTFTCQSLSVCMSVCLCVYSVALKRFLANYSTYRLQIFFKKIKIFNVAQMIAGFLIFTVIYRWQVVPPSIMSTTWFWPGKKTNKTTQAFNKAHTHCKTQPFNVIVVFKQKSEMQTTLEGFLRISYRKSSSFSSYYWHEIKI